MPLPVELQGDQWTQRTARVILPFLVSRAKRCAPITYGQLDAEVVARGWGEHAMVTNYGRPLGAIGDALARTGRSWKVVIPPLNALVVNAARKVPGDGCDGYIATFARSQGKAIPLTAAENLSLVQGIHEDLSKFHRWDELLREYGLVPMEDDGLADPEGSFDGDEEYGEGGPESDAHRALKEYIAAHPNVVDKEAPWIGVVEHQFRSGDRVDVLLASGLRGIAVEVKAPDAPADEQVRGVFQCVKYEALLRATQRLRGFPPSGRAVLVLGGPVSEPAREAAAALGVRVIAGVVPR
jgi:hypothetical protein